MFKVVFFLWRRSDLTRGEYLRYYEDKHSVLIASILPRSIDYRRSYPIWDASLGRLAGPETGKALFNLAPFDSMTEVWYHDRGALDLVIASVKQSPAWETLEQDEIKFLNRAQQVFYAIDERGMEPTEADIAKTAGIKIIRYAQRVHSISGDEFKKQYEENVVEERNATVPGLIAYRRNYPMFPDAYTFAGGTHNPCRLDEGQFSVDLIEELWCADPKSAGRIINLLDNSNDMTDRESTCRVVVNESRSSFGTFMAPVAAY